jgi:hypothetical protein
MEKDFLVPQKLVKVAAVNRNLEYPVLKWSGVCHRDADIVLQT